MYVKKLQICASTSNLTSAGLTIDELIQTDLMEFHETMIHTTSQLCKCSTSMYKLPEHVDADEKENDSKENLQEAIGESMSEDDPKGSKGCSEGH